jgi:hypothetical protein
MRKKPWTAEDSAECLASALIASAAACTAASQDTEVFLHHVAVALGQQAEAAGPNASRALRHAAALLHATEPPPAMCVSGSLGIHSH